VTYVDTTVTGGNEYSYRVMAMNGTVPSLAYTNTASVSVPGVPVAPTGFDVATGTVSNTLVLTWAHGCGPDLASFTIQRATDARFTKSLNTSPVTGCVLTTTQTVNPKTTYYYRIKANNSTGGSSAWTNALTFPIRTP
jgi:phosphodiesterase/alkaline phosphatase D-like protein